MSSSQIELPLWKRLQHREGINMQNMLMSKYLGENHFLNLLFETIRRYKLSSQGIVDIVHDIKDKIGPARQRSHAIPGSLKLLSTLQVLASGTYPWCIWPIRIGHQQWEI